MARKLSIQKSTRSERVQQTLDRLKVAVDTYARQYSREAEDLAFQVPEKQWPPEIRERLLALIEPKSKLPRHSQNLNRSK